MKRLALLLFLIMSSISVYAQIGIETEMTTYQGAIIHVNLIEITSLYDAAINITYPNGTDKVFIPEASIVGRRIYIFNNTQQLGNYFFHSYDVVAGQWTSSTIVEVPTSLQILSSFSIVPTGATIGIIGKEIEEDWMITSPFANVILGNATCSVKLVGGGVVRSGVIPTFNMQKKMTFETMLNATVFSRRNSYEVLCSFDVSVGTSKVRIIDASQYFYVVSEDTMIENLDNILLSQRQQYNRTTLMFSNLNSTFLNTRILINATRQINLTTNQILANTTKLLNITRTNQGILSNIWIKVQSIWNWVSQNNQTLSKINQTIVSNNTFMIEQLKKDRISAIS